MFHFALARSRNPQNTFKLRTMKEQDTLVNYSSEKENKEQKFRRTNVTKEQEIVRKGIKNTPGPRRRPDSPDVMQESVRGERGRLRGREGWEEGKEMCVLEEEMEEEDGDDEDKEELEEFIQLEKDLDLVKENIKEEEAMRRKKEDNNKLRYITMALLDIV